MKNILIRFITLLAVLIPILSSAQSAEISKPLVGPEKGSLMIVGGGTLSDTIMKRFIELAGGPDAQIVVIPTAGELESYGQNDAGAGSMRRLGAKKVTVIHTSDKKTANSDSFIEPLVEATGVWFGGGRQWRLVDAYKGTRTERMFWQVLDRGGVIGGSSAGATIQGSFLTRGDTKNNQIMMGDHQEGFGFVKNIAIDQHVLARDRQFDMFEILMNKPGLLGIGIDENTAVVVKGDTFEVLGRSYVLIYDGTFWSREGSDLKKIPDKERVFYLLRQGDKYNLAERRVIQ